MFFAVLLLFGASMEQVSEADYSGIACRRNSVQCADRPRHRRGLYTGRLLGRCRMRKADCKFQSKAYGLIQNAEG